MERLKYQWLSRLFALWMGIVATGTIIYLLTQFLSSPTFWIITKNGNVENIQPYNLDPVEIWTGIVISAVALANMIIQLVEEIIPKKSEVIT